MIGIVITTSECNLSCQYCYQHALARGHRKSGKEIQSQFASRTDVLKQYFETLSRLGKHFGRSVHIIFHGGEPLLINDNQYEELFIKLHELDNIQIQVQTNGTLIRPSLIPLFQKYGVSVVMSIDGTQIVHDAYRVNAGGTGTFEMVMNAVHLLKKENISVSASATITDQSCDKALEIYDFFNEIHLNFSVNRCYPDIAGNRLNGSITEEEYHKFLSVLYDRYEKRKESDVNIYCFDRSLHDLKRIDVNTYSFYLQSSPYLSILNAEKSKLKFIDQHKIIEFNDFNTYEAYVINAIESHRKNSAVCYTGSLKDCIIEHLCREQYEEFLEAKEANS